MLVMSGGRERTKDKYCSLLEESSASGCAGLTACDYGRPIAALFCERTRLQLRPFLHWCVRPKESMAPARRLNISKAPGALPSPPLGHKPLTTPPVPSCA